MLLGDQRDARRARLPERPVEGRIDVPGDGERRRLHLHDDDHQRPAALDDDLRKIEQGLKAREDADWKSNNPETKARQNDMTQQLRDAIAGLEADLEKAKASKDKNAIAKATEALEARKSWLKALGG